MPPRMIKSSKIDEDQASTEGMTSRRRCEMTYIQYIRNLLEYLGIVLGSSRVGSPHLRVKSRPERPQGTDDPMTVLNYI